MSSSYRITLDAWLRQLDVKADKVLDIGGAQEQMPKRVKSWDVKEYLIADLEKPHRDSLRPDIVLDMNDQCYDMILPKDIYETFDMIFCLEVYDYVWHTTNAFEIIERMLKKGGTAWISFPSFYPAHQPIEDDSLRYMEAGIKKLAEYSGLQIVQMIKRRPETNLLQQFFSAERLRAAKHYDHAFTGWIVEFKKNDS